jgi:hypothetical protein
MQKLGSNKSKKEAANFKMIQKFQLCKKMRSKRKRTKQNEAKMCVHLLPKLKQKSCEMGCI